MHKLHYLSTFYITTLLLLIPLSLPLKGIAQSSHDYSIDPSSNDPQQNKQRPKIGLVLSGGGARGFAHIGVLKVLEENRIPVDFIAGASMGSIIGGLYAIGLTPEEIEQGVQGIEWGKVFNDESLRKYQKFRRKQQDLEFYNIARIGLTDNGLEIAPGLIEGQLIELALDRLAHPGFHIDDYDDFSIPFRAIATDVENGRPYVIDHGNLARAMRASMSIPGALPPIKIDNKLLIDGGIGNNIPVDVVRAMGADIVIAVDVSSPLLDKEAIKSSLDMTGQLTDILTHRAADAQLESLTQNDIIITPELDQFSSTDFIQFAQLIKTGLNAANNSLDALKELSLDRQAYAEYKRGLPRIALKQPVIEYIEIINQSLLSDEAISTRIHQPLGQPLDLKLLERNISIIYGLDYSSSVVYSLHTENSKTGLIVYVRDRKWVRSYLEYGLQIQSESNLGSNTNINIAYNNININALGAEIRATATLGNEPSIGIEYHQPFDINLSYFATVKAGYETERFPQVNDGDIDAISRFQETSVRFSLGKGLTHNSELRLDLFVADGQIETLSGVSPINNTEYDEGGYALRFSHDSLDNINFPNSGYFGHVSYIENQTKLGADANYSQIKLSIGGAGTYRRYTVFTRALVETTLDENAPANNLIRRGGFLELSGHTDKQLASQHFGLIEAAFYRRLGDISLLPTYTGVSIEVGNAWNDRSEISANSLLFAGSLFIGANSFLGPIYLALGVAEGGEKAIYFNLGRAFIK